MPKPIFKDVVEAAQLLARAGAKLSLRDKTVGMTMKQRGLKTLAAADFVCRVYGLRLIDTDA